MLAFFSVLLLYSLHLFFVIFITATWRNEWFRDGKHIKIIGHTVVWRSSLKIYDVKHIHLKYSYLGLGRQKPKTVSSGIEDLSLTKQIFYWITMKQRKLIFLKASFIDFKHLPTAKDVLNLLDPITPPLWFPL